MFRILTEFIAYAWFLVMKMISSIVSLCTRSIVRRGPRQAQLGGNLFSTRNASHTTVDSNEARKFAGHAEKWWSDMYLLEKMNEVRVPFVRDGLLALSQHSAKNPYPLAGYKIIDVGCGGGMLSEPLAKIGATITGLDPVQELIDVANIHASKDKEVKDRITYVCDTIENITESSLGLYDAVVCSEVIEHVSDVQPFLDCCVKITKEGGSLFFTTISRTLVSYALAIIGAEYVLRIIPRGTHDWNKFITPKELTDSLKLLNCRVVSTQGTVYNPISQTFSPSNMCEAFYALHALKLKT